MKKMGRGHLAAMGRLGLRELRQAAYPDGNVSQPSELGLYGTALPSEVAEARKDPEPGPERDDSNGTPILASKMNRSPQKDSPDKEGPAIEPLEPERD